MTTPEERAEAPRHIFTFRIDGQLDPIAIKACSQIQGTSTGIKWIVGGPLGKAIASAIGEAVEAEQDNYDGLKSDLDSLLTAVICRINGEKAMDSLAEYIRMNYPKQAQAIRSRSEKP